LEKSLNLPELEAAVRVEWLDSTGQSGWHYRFDKEPICSTPRCIVSLGWLKAVGSEAITLAHSLTAMGPLDLTEGYRDPLIIPLGCIRHVKVLS
jgi:hypothetical protein